MKSFLARFRRPETSRPPSPGLPIASSDIVSQLPFELQVLVVVYLDVDDLLSALNVCRSWRHVWLSDEVWPMLAERWFPGLVGHIRQVIDADDALTAPLLAPGEVFRQHAWRIRRRVSGRFRTAWHKDMRLHEERAFTLSRKVPVEQGGVHSIDKIPEIDDFQKENISPRFMLYSNGRIAWWPVPYGLPYLTVVDDFRTAERRIYQFPNHGGRWQGYRTAMSSKMLVMGRDKVLHAWHFDRNCLRSVEVPKGFKRCVTEGEMVLIVCYDAQVYLWRFGGALQHIPMDRFPCYPLGPVQIGSTTDFPPVPIPSHRTGLQLRENGRLVDFIIHPFIDSTFFVITLTPEAPRKLVVYEFCDAELVNSYDFQDRILDTQMTTDPAYLRWEKADSYGGFCLTRFATGACHCGAASKTVVSICFNVYTKRLTSVYHHLPTTGTSGMEPDQIWNEQASIGMSGYFEANFSHLISVDCCTVDGRAKGPPAVYSSRAEGTAGIARRCRLPPEELQIPMRDESVDFVFKTHEDSSPLTDAMVGWTPLRVVGDDDFLVFVNHHWYSVWSFGNDLPPRDGADSDKASWLRKFREV